MRYKSTLALIVVFGLVLGLGANEEKKTENNNTKALSARTTPAVKPVQDQAKEQDQVQTQDSGKCYGEALNVNERDGKTMVYSQASRSSGTIAVLNDYEKVEITEVIAYGWLKVKLADGREGYTEAIRIRTKKLPAHNYSPNRPGYTMVYNQSGQTLKFYKDGAILFESKGSSGITDEFTPKGVFKIDKNLSGEWDYSAQFKQGYQYWVSFYEAGYLLHSIPFSEDKKVIPEEARKLGQPASHGCIRLPIPVAKYIYENIPDGTMMIIE